MSKLLELADRCEHASGPCRKLDWDIDQATCNSSIHSDHLDRFKDAAKPYTSSLDAITSLIPKGLSWSVSDPANADGSRSTFGYASWCHAYVEAAVDGHNYAKTPALALCVATLRALAYMEKSK